MSGAGLPWTISGSEPPSTLWWNKLNTPVHLWVFNSKFSLVEPVANANGIL